LEDVSEEEFAEDVAVFVELFAEVVELFVVQLVESEDIFEE
jgi:hypothetical protein